jgi:hypothetical protein
MCELRLTLLTSALMMTTFVIVSVLVTSWPGAL